MLNAFAKKIIVTDFYISHSPMENAQAIDLAASSCEIIKGDPIFVAITGRSSGFWGLLRELIGIPKRFEFILSKNQALERFGSTSTQVVRLSKLKGLNSITAIQYRPILKAIIGLIIALTMLTLLTTSIINLDSSNLNLFYIAALMVIVPVSIFNLLVAKFNAISLSESGSSEIRFVMSPNIFGSTNRNLTNDDLNTIVQIFRILKDI